MSAFTQERILRSIGMCLMTMLALVLAKAAIQITGIFNLNQELFLLLFLFPLFALLCGAAARLMTGSIWSAAANSFIAFGVVIGVLFRPNVLIYIPLYVVLSLFGYTSIQWIRNEKPVNS